MMSWCVLVHSLGTLPHVLRFSVENAYLEEKEDTCNALGEIAENMGYVPRQWLVHTRHARQVLSLVYITETQFSLIIDSHSLRFDSLVVLPLSFVTQIPVFTIYWWLLPWSQPFVRGMKSKFWIWILKFEFWTCDLRSLIHHWFGL